MCWSKFCGGPKVIPCSCGLVHPILTGGWTTYSFEKLIFLNAFCTWKVPKIFETNGLATCLVFLPWHRTLHCCVSATRTRCGPGHPVLRRGVRLRFAKAKSIELSISGSDGWFISSWWFQPIWKIVVKLGHFRQKGVKKKIFETTTWFCCRKLLHLKISHLTNHLEKCFNLLQTT